MPAEEPVHQQPRLGWELLPILLFLSLVFGLVFPFVKSTAGRGELTNTYLAVSVGFACLCTLLGAGIGFLSRRLPLIIRLLILAPAMMALMFLSLWIEQELGYRLGDASYGLMLLGLLVVETPSGPSET